MNSISVVELSKKNWSAETAHPHARAQVSATKFRCARNSFRLSPVNNVHAITQITRRIASSHTPKSMTATDKIDPGQFMQKSVRLKRYY